MKKRLCSAVLLFTCTYLMANATAETSEGLCSGNNDTPTRSASAEEIEQVVGRLLTNVGDQAFICVVYLSQDERGPLNAIWIQREIVEIEVERTTMLAESAADQRFSVVRVFKEERAPTGNWLYVMGFAERWLPIPEDYRTTSRIIEFASSVLPGSPVQITVGPARLEESG